MKRAGVCGWTTSRGLLARGTLARYIAEDSVTGLTSNPTIFDQAIEGGSDYDIDIATRKAAGVSDEEVFFELALTDLRRAADLFAPVHEYSDGVDGWVSLEVSPLLARDPRATIEQVKALHAKAGRPNLFIKIPGTSEGLPAIEECTFAGLPINATLLFSAEQYQAAAEAFLRGIERRVQAGLDPAVSSVGSVFASRWDTAVADRVPHELRDRLGIAAAPWIFQVHATAAWLFLALFPFTRFVHFWSAPVWYLSRPFVLYRRRRGDVVLSPGESRSWQTFGRLNRGPRL
jgi:transaldolase